jgi:hypothetical protein
MHASAHPSWPGVDTWQVSNHRGKPGVHRLYATAAQPTISMGLLLATKLTTGFAGALW